MQLPDDHRFTLRAGDRVVLLRSRGGRAVIQGPAVGTIELLIRQGRARNVPQVGNATVR